jgi:hypothetical protein
LGFSAINSWLKDLFEPRWPEGEPVMTPGGLRYGTQLADGRIVLARGFRVTRLPEQQAEGAPQRHGDADRVQDEA